MLYQIGIGAFCLVGAYVTLSETFSKPDYQAVRVVVFALIISYAIIPVCHQVCLFLKFDYEPQNITTTGISTWMETS